MTGEDYRKLAARTLIDKPDHEISEESIMIVWNALGLAGEAGEVADLVKKAIFHNHGLDTVAIEKELGDVLWYVAALCSKLNINMDVVMNMNIEKLKQRYPLGYSSERSIGRKEVPDGK